MNSFERAAIRDAGSLLQTFCYSASVAAGFHHDIETGEPRAADVPLKLVLIHSEISEALEGHRKGLADSKIPSRSALEVELADAVIRIFDLGGALSLDLGGAIAEKMQYNESRPDHKREARRALGGKKY